ncbi:MAG TPA: hypothetical protein VGK73_32230 [Polyangiaceae bacterium]
MREQTEPSPSPAEGEGVSRRTFLFLGGAAIVAAASPLPGWGEKLWTPPPGSSYVLFKHQADFFREMDGKNLAFYSGGRRGGKTALIKNLVESGRFLEPHILGEDGKPVEYIVHAERDPVLDKLDAPVWDTSGEWWKEDA